jgi:hypothetical protein
MQQNQYENEISSFTHGKPEKEEQNKLKLAKGNRVS